MRHRKYRGRLNRPSDQRKALVRNLVASLLTHEKVSTTQARASEVRRYAEKMITLARDGSQPARRRAFAFLQKKDVVHRLFEDLGPRFADRDSGFLRIVKTDRRQGDGAQMAILEMVDREIEIIDAEEAERRKSRSQRMRDMRRAVSRGG